MTAFERISIKVVAGVGLCGAALALSPAAVAAPLKTGGAACMYGSAGEVGAPAAAGAAGSPGSPERVVPPEPVEQVEQVRRARRQVPPSRTWPVHRWLRRSR